jgi:hypothetical protein
MERQRAVLVVILLSIATQASAQVARVFLSGTGDDANDCSNAATPCRSLQGAVNQSPANGEVIVMTSGGFGTATITKSLTINAPSGIVAFNARTITVTIAPTDKVVIRGLSMNGAVFADTYGIRFTSGGTLVVENSTVAGFLYAIGQEASGSNLIVNHCAFRNNNIGVFSQFSSGTDLASLTIENSRFENNSGFGVFLYDHIRAVVRDSLATGNARAYGIWQNDASEGSLLLDGCVASGSIDGVWALGANQNAATVRLTNSTIVGNDNGLTTILDGQIVSQGKNHIWGNTASEAFSSAVAQQ